MLRKVRMTPTCTIRVQVGKDDVDAYLRVRVSFDPGVPRWQGELHTCPSDVDWAGASPSVEAIEEIEKIEELVVGDDESGYDVLDGDDPLVIAAVERELLPVLESEKERKYLDQRLNETLDELEKAQEQADAEEAYRLRRRYEDYHWWRR